MAAAISLLIDKSIKNLLELSTVTKQVAPRIKSIKRNNVDLL
jgi:hypothetical protein